MSLRDPQTQKALLGVILVLGLAYAFYQYLYTPKVTAVAELEAQADRLESYNQSAKVVAQGNRIAALEEEGVSYARRLEAFEELIPTTEQVPLLLERIATSALEADVDLLAFTPLPAEPGTFYTEQFYEVEVRGGYHEIGNFLTRIANLPRIIKPTITELLGERVSPPAGGRAGASDAPPPTLVHAKLQLSTYVLPGGEAPVPGGADGSVASGLPAGSPGVALPDAPPASDAGRAPGLAPGLAPAFQSAPPAPPAQAEETGAAAPPSPEAPASTPPAAVGARPDTGSVTVTTPAVTGPAAADPPPTQVGRSTPTEDPSSPGALPPLGGGN
ncbi:MAG: type 4a pilus biogenesis protein PilO [Gemmatimonadota bacterium]